MKAVLQVQTEIPNSITSKHKAANTASGSPDDVHLLNAMKRISDPKMRYAVSMLVDCLTADLDREDRKVGLQVYFSIIYECVSS